MKKKHVNLVITMVLLCAMVGMTAATAVTNAFEFSGIVKDSKGNLLTGTYEVTFNLYASATAKNVLSSSTNSVNAVNGTFQTTLMFPTKYFDGRALWIGIKKGADPELKPRTRLFPSPYALSLRPRAILKEAFFTTEGSDGSNSSQISAVSVSTTYKNNPGVYITTSGEMSHGITARTIGDASYGVNVTSWGKSSYGVLTSTYGDDYCEALYSVAYGRTSRAIRAYSLQFEGINSATGRTDNKWGLNTPDYVFALGYQAPTADIAEFMPVNGEVAPGTVLVIGNDGTLEIASSEYDTRVAGIVSTTPAITLGNKEYGTFEEIEAREANMNQQDGKDHNNVHEYIVANTNANTGEVPVAISGRVPCKVDARYSAIHPGDLLTTSNTSGHARKAEPTMIDGRGFYPDGTILGKAMGILENGTGTIEVLVTLQ